MEPVNTYETVKYNLCRRVVDFIDHDMVEHDSCRSADSIISQNYRYSDLIIIAAVDGAIDSITEGDLGKLMCFEREFDTIKAEFDSQSEEIDDGEDSSEEIQPQQPSPSGILHPYFKPEKLEDNQKHKMVLELLKSYQRATDETNKATRALAIILGFGGICKHVAICRVSNIALCVEFHFTQRIECESVLNRLMNFAFNVNRRPNVATFFFPTDKRALDPYCENNENAHYYSKNYDLIKSVLRCALGVSDCIDAAVKDLEENRKLQSA